MESPLTKREMDEVLSRHSRQMTLRLLGLVGVVVLFTVAVAFILVR